MPSGTMKKSDMVHLGGCLEGRIVDRPQPVGGRRKHGPRRGTNARAALSEGAGYAVWQTVKPPSAKDKVELRHDLVRPAAHALVNVPLGGVHRCGNGAPSGQASEGVRDAGKDEFRIEHVGSGAKRGGWDSWGVDGIDSSVNVSRNDPRALAVVLCGGAPLLRAQGAGSGAGGNKIPPVGMSVSGVVVRDGCRGGG